MKCQKCGGPLSTLFHAFVTKTCLKCALGGPTLPDFIVSPKPVTPEIDAYVPDIYKLGIDPSTSNIPDFTTTHECTGTWWIHTSELSFIPKHIFAQDPVFFGNPSAEPCTATTPSDPTLEAIGRAFDDALDLAYLS